MAGIYDNGAHLNSSGALLVSSNELVQNLNADYLHGTQPKDFVRADFSSSDASAASSANFWGIEQKGKTINLSGVKIVADSTSQFKLGNIVIASATDGEGVDGNAILIGLE